MEISRLTTLLGADQHEVEALVSRIEQRGAADRAELLADLARALRLDEHAGGEDRGQANREPRTELADAVAIDLGFD